MIEKLLAFVNKPTSKHVIINTLGNYLNVFFTALFALILVRILSPAQYGVLSVLLGIAYVLANVLDFGTTATIYSYFPLLYEKRSERLYTFIKSTFFYQSLFSFIVIGFLLVFFPFLDRSFFRTGAPTWELYLTAISVLFFIWQNFVLNILFAAKKFFHANLYLNISNVLKTLLILFFAYAGMVSVGAVIFTFGILGPLIFFLILLVQKKDLFFILSKSKIDRNEFKFGYTLTYFAASQFFNLGLRMDLFLLSYFGNKDDVGFYGLSQKIILTVITTVVSITQVLSPSFSSIKTQKEAWSHIKTGFLYLLLPSALFVLLFILPTNIYQLFFTSKFTATVPITRALSLPFIVYTLGSLPMLILLYTVKKPAYILYTNIIFFVVFSALCWYLIPMWGVMGPPVAIGIALFLTSGLQTLAAIKEFRRLAP